MYSHCLAALESTKSKTVFDCICVLLSCKVWVLGIITSFSDHELASHHYKPFLTVKLKNITTICVEQQDKSIGPKKFVINFSNSSKRLALKSNKSLQNIMIKHITSTERHIGNGPKSPSETEKRSVAPLPILM